MNDDDLDFITAYDLWNEAIPPTKMVVQNLIPIGLTVLAGDPKSGKSMTMFAVAHAIATGGKVFGELDVERGDVLYCALEDHKARLKSRMKILNMDSPSTRLRLATRMNPLSEGGIAQLERHLTLFPETQMVIIDTLARVADATEGYNYQQDAIVGAGIQQIALAYEVAVVVIHHTAKASNKDFLKRVSGTQGIPGVADTVAVFTRARQESYATLEVTGRDITERKLDLTWYSPMGGWVTNKAREERRRMGRTPGMAAN